MTMTCRSSCACNRSWFMLTMVFYSPNFHFLFFVRVLETRMSIVQYTVFDQLKQRLLKGKLSQKTGSESSPEALSAFSAFVLGAVSKCVATCLTYPAIRWMVNPITLAHAFHYLCIGELHEPHADKNNSFNFVFNKIFSLQTHCFCKFP